MSDGGAGADAIGSWFGTGPDRGMALVFVLTGVIGIIATTAALASRPYRALSRRVSEESPAADTEPATA
jgi:DHA3 family multidrug efflux protein-like MFS transporter